MFISLSSTCIQNFSNLHALFVFLSHSVAVAARSGIQRVDPQMIHFALFKSPGAQLIHSTPNNICLVYTQLKKNILGIHPKRIIFLAPFHSNAFVILYKFETSRALIDRLSRGLFAISGASKTLLFGLLTM